MPSKSSNRPTLFKVKRPSAIQTDLKDSATILNSSTEESSNSLSAKVDIEEDMELFRQVARESAQCVIDKIVIHLNSLNNIKKASEAIILVSELSGLSNSYSEPGDKLVVSEIQHVLIDFLPEQLADRIKKTGRYPSYNIHNLTLIPKIIPNYVEEIKFHTAGKNDSDSTPSSRLSK